MPLNLVQHRGAPNVWEQIDRRDWDAERWLVAITASVFLIAGLRQRSLAGLLFVLGGSSLAWWAAAGPDERNERRGRLRAALPARRRDIDLFVETSEQSFPASDAPAWTATTGNTSTCAGQDGKNH